MPLLIGLLGSVLASFLVRLLATIGIGFTTYTIVLPNLLSYMQAQIASLPLSAVEILGIMRFDICITIIVSAYAARGVTGFFMNKITP